MESIYLSVRQDILPLLKCDDGHKEDHFRTVENHVIEASKELEEWQIQVLRIAAYCHDLDDAKLQINKIFSTGAPERSTVQLEGKEYPVMKNLESHYPNLYSVLCKCLIAHKDLIMTIVDLVSCSKNGDSYDPDYPTWYYYVRYCDRLEAIGEIGLQRVIQYDANRNYYDEDTIRVYSLEDLKKAATKERYQEYTTGKRTSKTKIDHLYDKVLHIKLPDFIENNYLRDEFRKRQSYIERWVIDFWTTKRVTFWLSQKVIY